MSANGVRERRTALLLTQVQLAALAGISDETLRKIEQGKRVSPTNMRRVLDALEREERDRGSRTQPTTTDAAGDVVPASRYDRSGRDLVADAYEQMRLINEASRALMDDLERLLDDKGDPPTRERDRSDDPLSDPRA